MALWTFSSRGREKSEPHVVFHVDLSDSDVSA